MKYHTQLLIALILSLTIVATPWHGNVYSQTTSDIEIKLRLDKQTYKIGESITAVCEFRNLSNSTIWLPPLQIVDVHFTLHRNWVKVLPFEIPSMTLYPLDKLHFIEFRPAKVYTFKRILDKETYRLPEDAGQYRLCIHYENDRTSMRNIDLWVGKIESCVPLKINKGGQMPSP